MFFQEGGLHPSPKALYCLAVKVIQTLRKVPLFSECDYYLRFMRKMGTMIESATRSIYGNDWDTYIAYFKLRTVRIKICVPASQPYKKDRQVTVSITRHVRDNNGKKIKDNSKNASAFAANYTHLLDASVCSYVIMTLQCPLATVHDSFLIQPKNFEQLNKTYRKGLTKTQTIHRLNLWRLVNMVAKKNGVKSPTVDNWADHYEKILASLPTPEKKKLKMLTNYIANGGACSQEFASNMLKIPAVSLFPD